MISRRNPVTCLHCGVTFDYPCDHSRRLANLSKAEHDAVLARSERMLEARRFHMWLREDHPARALSCIANHARNEGRRFTF